MAWRGAVGVGRLGWSGEHGALLNRQWVYNGFTMALQWLYNELRMGLGWV
jgi:hypothetical protein